MKMHFLFVKCTDKRYFVLHLLCFHTCMQLCILQCSELDFLCLHLDILLKIVTNSLIIRYSTKYFNMTTGIFSLSRALNSLQNIS